MRMGGTVAGGCHRLPVEERGLPQCQSSKVPQCQSSKVPPAIHRSIFCPNPRHGSKPFYSPSSSWPTGSMCRWSDCVERRLPLGVLRSSRHSAHSGHSGHSGHCPQSHPRLLGAHNRKLKQRANNNNLHSHH